jgi:hypothetical protein
LTKSSKQTNDDDDDDDNDNDSLVVNIRIQCAGPVGDYSYSSQSSYPSVYPTSQQTPSNFMPEEKLNEDN